MAIRGLVRPIAMLVPEWVPAENVLSLILIMIVCILIGAAARTSAGRATRQRIEKSLLVGAAEENVWKPALVEIEDALVPAFIIEEFADGRFTVFVPSVPTPLAGAVYILSRERVHPLDVPFTQATRSVAQWGSGSKELVAAMERAAASRKGPGQTS